MEIWAWMLIVILFACGVAIVLAHEWGGPDA